MTAVPAGTNIWIAASSGIAACTVVRLARSPRFGQMPFLKHHRLRPVMEDGTHRTLTDSPWRNLEVSMVSLV